MSEEILSAPTLQIGNDTVAIVPESLVIDPGNGERKVFSQATGKTIVTVHSIDLTTKKSKIKFELYTTDSNRALAKKWAALESTTVKESQVGGDSYNNCTLTNNLSLAHSSEGKFELIFEGDPLI